MLRAGEATTFSSSMRYIIIFVLQQQDYCGTEDRYSKLKNVNVFNLVLFYVYSYPTFVLVLHFSICYVCPCSKFVLFLHLSLSSIKSMFYVCPCPTFVHVLRLSLSYICPCPMFVLVFS